MECQEYMTVDLSDLQVTQSSIRNWNRVLKMVEFVRAGGIFTPEFIAEYHQDELAFPPQPMKIKRMPDGKLYLHDGHHRAIALWIAGRVTLHPDEYTLHDWPSYESFMEPNFAVGWVTPLDIRKEIRHPDIVPFKEAVMRLPEEERVGYIRDHRSAYCQPRKGIQTVGDLAACVLDGQCCINPQGCSLPKIE